MLEGKNKSDGRERGTWEGRNGRMGIVKREEGSGRVGKGRRWSEGSGNRK